MKRQFVSVALSSLFGLGVAMAAPQAQNQPSQDQPAQATQPAGRHAMDPNRQLQMLSKRLNLTADQQNQILPILTDRQQQMQSIFADNSLSRQDRHAKLHALREDSDAKIKAVLNDSQKQTYDQLLQQRREREHQHRDRSNIS